MDKRPSDDEINVAIRHMRIVSLVRPTAALVAEALEWAIGEPTDGEFQVMVDRFNAIDIARESAERN